jgi:acetyltransferase-like isoleucine patch superfamily enzyme
MKINRIIHKIRMAPNWARHKFSYFLKWEIMKISKNKVLNSTSLKIRPWLWKLTGVQILGSVKIGYDVYFDVGNSKSIIIEDGVWIASRSLLLCHKRDLSNYKAGDDYNKLGYINKEIILKRGSVVGMGAIIMPGVIIGEGAIVGAGSVVTKNVASWTIVTGNPARVVKNL